MDYVDKLLEKTNELTEALQNIVEQASMKPPDRGLPDEVPMGLMAFYMSDFCSRISEFANSSE